MGKNSDRELEKRIKAILGDFDPTVPPPKIAPVPEGLKRPTWSVMIPTYNCAKYLTQTLESVLEQDPGPEHMQIEVVDDCSTLDDPEKVVREVGKGRVAFHRNPKNSGYCTLNFNICIRRSIGNFVHILHGDDFVLNGFYKNIENLAFKNSNSQMYATGVVVVNDEGCIVGKSRFLSNLDKNPRNYTDFFFESPLQCAGIVVKREFYEINGGFLPLLIHAADWEMWVRCISIGGCSLSESHLAAYRIFEDNDTGRLARTADNLKDILKLTQIFYKLYHDFPYNDAIDRLIVRAEEQANKFQYIGNNLSAKAAEDFSKTLNLSKIQLYSIISSYIKIILKYFNKYLLFSLYKTNY